MKKRLMATLAAVALLLVAMPGLTAAAKPMPELTLTPNVQYCDAAPAFLEVDATWTDVKGPRAYISWKRQVRYAESTPVLETGVEIVTNDGEQAGVWSIRYPDHEVLVQAQLVRKNGRPISAWADTGWFSCPA